LFVFVICWYGVGVHGAFCDLPLPPLTGFFNGWSCQEIVNSMGTQLQPSNSTQRQPPPNIVIQPSWDWRTQDPTDCTRPIRSQGKCGSCWAFASTAVLSHRYCIIGKAHNVGGPIILSPQQKLDCDHTCSGQSCNSGCSGGYIDLAWKNFVDSGVVTDICVPYTTNENSCPVACTNTAYNYTSFQATSYYSLQTIADTQRDIQQYGPVTAGIRVYEDFLGFSGSSVYVYDGSSNLVGGHAVKIIGWGTLSSLDYWIVENSWGTSWGDQGYVKIKRGSNEVGIESYIVAGLPKIVGVDYNNDFSQSLAARQYPITFYFVAIILVSVFANCAL